MREPVALLDINHNALTLFLVPVHAKLSCQLLCCEVLVAQWERMAREAIPTSWAIRFPSDAARSLRQRAQLPASAISSLLQGCRA
jgi:hypothetical protein